MVEMQQGESSVTCDSQGGPALRMNVFSTLASPVHPQWAISSHHRLSEVVFVQWTVFSVLQILEKRAFFILKSLKNRRKAFDKS